ncbi:hypothetical protein BD847_2973 [Flavobacterium cutihirudinis]|uniref:Uncharacterized protein n=1 Tax=Flavobacterium cutihirudinis TaxID=1265740 RepID=A0A3D9FTK3_9FLAO|nr:hypothetical protein [Flavobacterium cutihirudinis]RED23895.1 hypothetical protein BD847_2973 [Flavobacterium cutihirudinis]
MNNIRILILIFFFIALSSNCQTNKDTDTDKLTSDFIKNLQSKTIDTICIYKNYCGGCAMKIDPDSIEICIDSPVYVFWKQNGKTFITKINHCWEYLDTAIKVEFWKIYFSNQNIIQKEKFEEFEYFPYKNIKEVKSSLLIDHSGVQIFKIILKDAIIEKHFNSFQMKKQNDSGIININYKHNNKLKSKLIMDILEKAVSEAEKNNTFKKIKSR